MGCLWGILGVLYIAFIIALSNTSLGADFAIMFGLVAWLPATFIVIGLWLPFASTDGSSLKGRLTASAISLTLGLALMIGAWIGFEKLFGY